MLEAKKAADNKRLAELAKYRKPFQVAVKDKGKQPFTYEGDFLKKTTGPKPGQTTQGGGGIGGNLGNTTPGGLTGNIPGGALGGGITTGGDGTGMGGVSTGTGIGGAQTLPGNGGIASNLPGQVPNGATIPGMGGDETSPGETAGGQTETGAVEMATPPAGSATPTVGKVGQTMSVQLDSKKAQDFNLDLPKGQFFVYVDAARIGEGSLTSNSDFSLLLLKRNGAEMPGYGGDLIYYNTRDRTTRVGKAFSFTKPTGVRFRIKNDADGANNFWITIVPATPVKWLPFGFGDVPKAIKIGPNIGTGGPLDARGYAYSRATIPAGKWSVSLGAKSEDNCSVDVTSYDERGVNYPGSFSIFGVGKDARKEKIITLSKPTTLIFRVLNDSQAENVNYDVTIEPSTD